LVTHAASCCCDMNYLRCWNSDSGLCKKWYMESRLGGERHHLARAIIHPLLDAVLLVAFAPPPAPLSVAYRLFTQFSATATPWSKSSKNRKSSRCFRIDGRTWSIHQRRWVPGKPVEERRRNYLECSMRNRRCCGGPILTRMEMEKGCSFSRSFATSNTSLSSFQGCGSSMRILPRRALV
jgi:hypothetical protein